jgi:hypothetical protein
MSTARSRQRPGSGGATSTGALIATLVTSISGDGQREQWRPSFGIIS